MARPAKYTVDDLLDAAASAAHEHGRTATIAQVAAGVGAPVGSVYHRFPSRDELFVTVWLRSIERFHEGLLVAMRLPDPRAAAVAAAVHIPRFCREHPRDAVAMTLYRQDLLAESAPPALAQRVAHVNDAVVDATRDLSERLYGSPSERQLQLVVIACQEGPYGLVRRYLRSSTPVPQWLDDVVRASSAAVLDLGEDAPGQ